MNKTENINVRVSEKDKKFLEDNCISPSELFRDALAKAKRRAKAEQKRALDAAKNEENSVLQESH